MPRKKKIEDNPWPDDDDQKPADGQSKNGTPPKGQPVDSPSVGFKPITGKMQRCIPYLSFVTARGNYAALLNEAQTAFLPVMMLPSQRAGLSAILTDQPTMDIALNGPYQVLLDTLKSMGCSVYALFITGVEGPAGRRIFGGINVHQTNDLGTNVGVTYATPADVVILSAMIEHPVHVEDAAFKLFGVELKVDSGVPIADQIVRSVAILENAAELKMMLGDGSQ